MLRRNLIKVPLGLASLSVSPLIRAQASLSSARSINLLVPFAPGGGTDIVARAIAPKLSERLGVSVVVDNKPGAGTVIGAELVARARPDGTTLLLSGASTWSINPAMRNKLRYDALKDFSPVAIIARVPLLLLVPAESELRSVQDLVVKAKAQPGRLNYATHGPGTVPHLAGELLQMAASIKLADVAYKGSAPAMFALLSKEVEVSLDTAASAAPQIKAGKIRALANFGAVRSPLLPTLPTIAEAGYPGATFDGWYGVAAPGGTPAPVVERLSRELLDIMKLPDIRASLQAQSIDTAAVAAAAMGKQIEAEISKYRALAYRAGIRLD